MSNGSDYIEGVRNALALVATHGMEYAARTVGYDCQIVVSMRRDLLDYVVGESDALLLLASSEAPRTLADVEAYENGFTYAESVTRLYGLSDAIDETKHASATLREPAAFAFAVGQSDALLLAATTQDAR